MPHLNELQAKHADDGVTIIAVTTEDKSNTLEAVKAMVKDKADVMGHTVAWDDKGQTYANYMTATGSRGIPTSFVIDKEGSLAFIGHPMNLDKPLQQIIDGTWDSKKFKAEREEAQAKQAAAMKIRRASMEIQKATQNSVTGKGAGEVMEMWDAFVAKHPSEAREMPELHYRVLAATGQYDKAAPIGAKIIAAAVADKDPMALNQITWNIVDPERKLEKRDLMLAVYGATMACTFTDYKNAAMLDTLARAHYLAGGVKRAIELQKLAIEHADERMKPSLQGALQEYEGAGGL